MEYYMLMFFMSFSEIFRLKIALLIKYAWLNTCIMTEKPYFIILSFIK
jgi:hypothetical protein